MSGTSPAGCGSCGELLVPVGYSPPARKTASVAVNPWRNDRGPTGPISPPQKNPATGAPPSASAIARASWSGSSNIRVRDDGVPADRGAALRDDGLDGYAGDHSADRSLVVRLAVDHERPLLALG